MVSGGSDVDNKTTALVQVLAWPRQNKKNDLDSGVSTAVILESPTTLMGGPCRFRVPISNISTL